MGLEPNLIKKMVKIQFIELKDNKIDNITTQKNIYDSNLLFFTELFCDNSTRI